MRRRWLSRAAQREKRLVLDTQIVVAWFEIVLERLQRLRRARCVPVQQVLILEQKLQHDDRGRLARRAWHRWRTVAQEELTILRFIRRVRVALDLVWV